MSIPVVRAKLPANYAQILEGCVGFHDGANADGSYVLGAKAALALEQQLKRVIGADEALDFNISQVREVPDQDLYRLLTLAVVGNFTSAKGSRWQQTFSVAVVQETGLFVINNGSTASDAALRVLLIVMCAVMFKRWVEDEARAQANLASSSAARPSPAKSD
jgi:hypothetical protein